MHELGLCSAIVDAVTERAGERQVTRVRVRVGRLHHVHPDAFAQSFTVAAMGTVAATATADLVLIPITARCPDCAHEWESDDLPLACPRCGETSPVITSGSELTLESISYLVTSS